MTESPRDPAPLFQAGPSDWALFVLALFSAALLTWPVVMTVTSEQMQLIRWVDAGICLIFLSEFLWHWRQAGWGWSYLGRNWYAFLAMVPVAHPALITNPWISLPLVFARIARAVDRVLGQGFVHRLLARTKDFIVQAVSNTVTLAVLDEVADVLVQGTYTRNISRTLEVNQPLLRAMVREKLRDDPQTGRLKRLPYYNELVGETTDTVLRITEEILKDPRTETLVAEMLRENIAQIRYAVASRGR